LASAITIRPWSDGVFGHRLDRWDAVRGDRPGGAIGGRARAGTRPAHKLDRTGPEPHWVRIESQHKLGSALGDATVESVAEAGSPELSARPA
jgi:hypothetical protein